MSQFASGRAARTWIDYPLTFRTTVPDELAQGQTVASGFRGNEVKPRAAGAAGEKSAAVATLWNKTHTSITVNQRFSAGLTGLN